MTTEERIIEVERLRLEIIRTVQDAYGWQGSWSEVKVTKELPYKRSEHIGPELILKRSNLSLYAIITALLLLIAVLYYFTKSDMALYEFGFLTFVMTCVLVYRNKNLASRIILNKQGIFFDETTFEWQNIFQTYIITEPSGRSTQTSLWIAMNDGSYQKMNISNYAYRFLGHYIEQYKRIYLLPS